MSGSRWTPEIFAQLGTKKDTEIAAIIGVTSERVRQVRRLLELPRHQHVRELIEKHGITTQIWEEKTNREIADLLGCSAIAVGCFRTKNKLPKRRKHSFETTVSIWLPEEDKRFLCEQGSGTISRGVRMAIKALREKVGEIT